MKSKAVSGTTSKLTYSTSKQQSVFQSAQRRTNEMRYCIMKNRITIASTISCLIAVTCIQMGQAHPEQNSEPQAAQTPYIPDSISHPLIQLDQQGTGDLQEKVLMQINDGLFNGSLSAADASQYKSQLNKLNDQESWYKSLNTAI